MPERVLGDQLKAVDSVETEPADIIHGGDIAGHSLSNRILDSLVLLVVELAKGTGNKVFLRLETIRLCRVDDSVSTGKAKLVGELVEEETETECGVFIHGLCFVVVGF